MSLQNPLNPEEKKKFVECSDEIDELKLPVKKIKFCKSFPLKTGDFYYTEWTESKIHRIHTFAGGLVKRFHNEWFEAVIYCTFDEENLLEAVSD